MSMKDLGGLMKQAQEMQAKMQEQMQAAQAEVANLRVTGEAGAGLARVVMNGRCEVVEIALDDALMKEDKAIIEDLVAAACNDAVRRAKEAEQAKMAEAAQGFGLPGGLDLGGIGDLFGKMKF